MSKVLFSILLTLVFLFQPGKVIAYEDCSSPSKNILIDVEANGRIIPPQVNIGVQMSFRIYVKIPAATIQHNWNYYPTVILEPAFIKPSGIGPIGIGPDILRNPTLKGTSVSGGTPNSGTENIGGIQYSVSHWDFPNGLPSGQFGFSDFNEYRLFLEHSEAPGSGVVCQGPEKHIRTANNQLPQVESCPLNMPGNFQSPATVTGIVNLKSIPGITYLYRLDRGNLLSGIPRDPLNPIIIAPGSDPTENRLPSGINVPLPPKSITDNDTYTATVYAVSNTLAFACGARTIIVSNNPTTSPNSEGGTTIVPEQEKGTGGRQVTPATAGGIPCDNNTGFQTAIGCIHTSPVALVKDFLKFGLGIGGGLAFLMMLLGAFQMLTSAGNPETLATGKDRLTNAVIGLLFVIFSVLLLQIIGVGILDIPGFK